MALPALTSIVIDNYNYGRFLGRAIESALSQAHSPVEVIVVDDGSTDGSSQVIRDFGDRITPVFKKNGGQASAFNAGLYRSQGEVVIFLDADDILLPNAVQRVREAFDADPSAGPAAPPLAGRVQFRMEVIDAHGRKTGEIKPAAHIPAPAGDLRRQVLAFPFDLPWLPTSGNAFARWVLEEIFPIPEEEYRILADYYLSNITPLYGRVLFLEDVLAYYRVHGANSYEVAGKTLDLEQVRKTIQHAYHTRRHIQRFSDRLQFEDTPRNGQGSLSVSDIANRLVSIKLEPERHPVEVDSPGKLLALGFAATARRFDVSLAMKVLFILWFLAVAIVPGPVARWLATLFFYPQKRGGMNKLLRRFHRA